VRVLLTALAAACVVAVTAGAAPPEGKYPVTLSATAEVTQGSTQVKSTITIFVDRLMLESRHTKVVDGLKYNGYQGFMDALRPLPVIGSIATDRNKVDLRYAWETEVQGKRRLILVADHPLFFLGQANDTAKKGYELTVVELIFDASGGATGTIAGAARVKPSPEGGVILGDFAEAPVKLTVRGTTS
jgi:hypothetical protein